MAEFVSLGTSTCELSLKTCIAYIHKVGPSYIFTYTYVHATIREVKYARLRPAGGDNKYSQYFGGETSSKTATSDTGKEMGG